VERCKSQICQLINGTTVVANVYLQPALPDVELI